MIATPDVLAGIPALPVAVAKVLEETGRDEPDARVITRAIETDAGLAAKMLSLVNSPYYGLSNTVTSLNQAVMIVGMRQVRNVALAVGALRSIPGIPGPVVDAFLDRAMVTSKTARSLAMKASLPAVEGDTAHLGGLLRGVGALAALRIGQTSPNDEEIAHLAKMVLEHWKLPSAIVECVAGSVGPFDPTTPSVACAVYVAAKIVDGATADIDPTAFDCLGIAPEDLAYYDPLTH